MRPFGTGQVAAIPSELFRSDADANLIRAQTDAIKALSKRIDELEARIAGLEGKRGASK
jgi:hypothetical protein